MAVSPEELTIFSEKVKKLSERYSNLRVLYNSKSCMDFSAIKIPDYGVRVAGCPGGSTRVFIDHKGDVYPCGYFPYVGIKSSGNLKKSSFSEIWFDSKELNQFRHYNEEETRNCLMCKSHRNPCNGKCPAASYTLKGSYCLQESKH